MKSNTLSVASKLLAPAIEHNRMVNNMNQSERIEYIKKKYNLTHGKGKRKKK